MKDRKLGFRLDLHSIWGWSEHLISHSCPFLIAQVLVDVLDMVPPGTSALCW